MDKFILGKHKSSAQLSRPENKPMPHFVVRMSLRAILVKLCKQMALVADRNNRSNR